jgi:hypothetical protein
MGFTPVVVNEEIKDYVENHKNLHVYQWGLVDNPLFANDPEKLERAMDEWSHLPEAMRNTRLSGEWYYEPKGKQVFENVHPECVPDFEVPLEWRRARISDPATHRTGAIILAEDPADGQWFVINAVELEWKNKLCTTADIEREIDKLAPYPEFQYTMSLYDNAESWFGSHQVGKQGRWRACVMKRKSLLIMQTRDAMVTKRVKFFKVGAAPLVKQIYAYRRKDDGEIYKKKDHMVDCLQYFCREIPPFIPGRVVMRPDNQEDMVKHHMDNLRKKWAQVGSTQQQQSRRQVTATARRATVTALRGRGLR